MNPQTVGLIRAANGSQMIWLAGLAGVVVGVAVIHPLSMVMYWFEFHPEFAMDSTVWAFVALRLRSGVSPAMWPMIGIFAAIGAALGLLAGWTMRILVRRQWQIARQRRELLALRQLLPICSWCKKVRDDQGYWQQVESYLARRGVAQFTHGICPSCEERVLAEDTLREAMGEVMRERKTSGGADGGKRDIATVDARCRRPRFLRGALFTAGTEVPAHIVS